MSRPSFYRQTLIPNLKPQTPRPIYCPSSNGFLHDPQRSPPVIQHNICLCTKGNTLSSSIMGPRTLLTFYKKRLQTLNSVWKFEVYSMYISPDSIHEYFLQISIADAMRLDSWQYSDAHYPSNRIERFQK